MRRGRWRSKKGYIKNLGEGVMAISEGDVAGVAGSIVAVHQTVMPKGGGGEALRGAPRGPPSPTGP